MKNHWCTVMLISALLSLCSGFRPLCAQEQFQEDTFKTGNGDLKITFMGHGTLMFAYGGRIIHIDPVSRYADYAKLPKADLILITHEHGDHLDAKAVQAVSTAKTAVIANQASARTLTQALVMANEETRTAAGFSVEAVPAYNLEKNFHPRGNGNGYIITFGDKRVYVAGDTENTPEMKALKNIDIAFLPMNLPYTMTPGMVADAARALQPKVLYPYHFGSTDTAGLVRLLKDEKGIDVRIRNMK